MYYIVYVMCNIVNLAYCIIIMDNSRSKGMAKQWPAVDNLTGGHCFVKILYDVSKSQSPPNAL